VFEATIEAKACAWIQGRIVAGPGVEPRRVLNLSFNAGIRRWHSLIRALSDLKGMSLPDFIRHYGTEAQCFDALFAWPRALSARCVDVKAAS
jgi:hypothetical protein